MLKLGWGETLAPGGLSFVGEQQTVVARALNPLGKRRDVRVRIPYPLAVGVILEGTDLVATLPSIVATRARSPHENRCHSCPGRISQSTVSLSIKSGIRVMMQIHFTNGSEALIRQIATERWSANSRRQVTA